MRLDALLASCDATCSALSLGCALAGYRAIRRKHVERHRALMLMAVAASTGFLVLFVIRFATFGFAPYGHGGVTGVAYRALLYSHEPLAVINIPLVVAAAVLGLRRSVRAHREVAPIALWIWLYVLVTGLLLFAVLYGA